MERVEVKQENLLPVHVEEKWRMRMSEPWTEAGYDSAEAYIEALKAKEQTLSNQVKAKGRDDSEAGR